MLSRRSKMNPAVRKLVDAWDAEIDAEEAEERQLRAQAQVAQRKESARELSKRRTVGVKLLKAAGVSEADARQSADESFARARKLGAGARTRALEVVKKRMRSNAAETGRLLAAVQKGRH